MLVCQAHNLASIGIVEHVLQLRNIYSYQPTLKRLIEEFLSQLIAIIKSTQSSEYSILSRLPLEGLDISRIFTYNTRKDDEKFEYQLAVLGLLEISLLSDTQYALRTFLTTRNIPLDSLATALASFIEVHSEDIYSCSNDQVLSLLDLHAVPHEWTTAIDETREASLGQKNLNFGLHLIFFVQ